MTLVEAQTVFNIRLYRWAETTLQTEMNSSFPSFKFCKEGPFRTCLFLKSLDQQSAMVLSRALLLERHKAAAKELNEDVSEEAIVMMRKEEGFRLRTLPGTWEEHGLPSDVEDKRKLATRRHLKSAVKKHFHEAFGEQCLPLDPLDGKAASVYTMKCRGWLIKTSFDFGGRLPEITFDHNVWTGEWITKENPPVLFANCLGFRLNYGNELGIGSGWDNISLEDLEPVCAEIVRHCRRMFEVFPTLMDGLDLELLTQ
jgi:hypothetical protein